MEHFLGYFNLAVAFFLIVSMAMMLGRLLGGPTLYDQDFGGEFLRHQDDFISLCFLLCH